ncbi:MAG TPA: FecR domain-containing protein [Chryseosolibacter sp.]
MEKEEYIKKWLEGSLTEAEKASFQETEEYRALERLSRSLASFKAPEYDAQAEYERLKARRSAGKKVVPMRWLSPVLKIAAVLTVLTGAYFFFLYDALTVVKTTASEKTVVTLPDASSVALNAESELSYSEKNWKKERRVQLDGEGYFQVAKGSRFEVKTSMGTVTVVGTVFNVRNRGRYFEVICYEGAVQVRGAGEDVRLSPKQLFRVIDGVVTKGKEVAEDQPDWRRGESSFRSVPFKYVLAEFERQFDVTVTTRNVDTRRLFTGSFSHSDFSVALKSIALPFNLAYEVEGKKIILSGGH